MEISSRSWHLRLVRLFMQDKTYTPHSLCTYFWMVALSIVVMSIYAVLYVLSFPMRPFAKMSLRGIAYALQVSAHSNSYQYIEYKIEETVLGSRLHAYKHVKDYAEDDDKLNIFLFAGVLSLPLYMGTLVVLLYGELYGFSTSIIVVLPFLLPIAKYIPYRNKSLADLQAELDRNVAKKEAKSAASPKLVKVEVKRPNLLIAYIKAVKNKVCPIIVVKD